MSAIAVWSPVDLILSLAFPLGLAANRGTAIVVDLDPDGPPLSGSANLAALVRRGPTADELAPKRRGVAVLANGGINAEQASRVIAEMARRWPNIVLRCAPNEAPPTRAIAVMPVLPDPYTITADGAVVYQRTRLGGDPPNGALALPAPRPSIVRSLLSGATPSLKDRWIRSLDAVWSLA